MLMMAFECGFLPDMSDAITEAIGHIEFIGDTDSMFAFLKKKAVNKMQEPINTTEPSEYIKDAEKSITDLKVKLIDLFTNEKALMLPPITDTMKNDAVSCLLNHIHTGATDAIRDNIETLTLISSHLWRKQSIPDKLREKVFSEVAKDLQIILKNVGVNSIITKYNSITIKLEDLRKFSNYEKLGTLK